MKITVLYSSPVKEADFGEGLGLIMNLLQKFGDVSLSSGFGLTQFTLTTSRRREEVGQALRKLRLKGKLTIDQMEEV